MLSNSALLTYVLEVAQRLSSADQRKITADYFLISLLSVLEAQEAGTLPEKLDGAKAAQELEEVRRLTAPLDLSYARLAPIIHDAIRASEDGERAEIAFKKLCFVGGAYARRLGKSTIDTAVYLRMIFDDPSDIIRCHVLHSEAKKEAPIPPAAPEADPAPDSAEAAPPASEPSVADQVAGWMAQRARVAGEIQHAKSSPDKEKKEPEPTPSPKTPKKEDEPESFAKTVADTSDIRRQLLDRVFGQDEAVNAFVSGYFQSRLMELSGRESRRPQALFLFAGPPGVGKTFLAESAAAALGLPYKRVDMSEYCDKEAVIEFCGSDRVYKDSKPGNITSFVAENPNCVLLFDEIEKAHITAIYLFLQILDAGRLRDNYSDREISFSKAVIIFTTNVGKNLYNDPSIPHLASLPRKQILKALETDLDPLTGAPLFPAAICSRFASGNVVMFNHLSVHHLFTIVRRELRDNITAMEASTGIKIRVDDEVATAIILSEGGRADARTVKGRVNAFFHEELYELFRLLSSSPGGLGKLKEVRVRVKTDPTHPETAGMFVNAKKPEVLLFAEPAKIAALGLSLPGVVCHVTDDREEAEALLFDRDISVVLCDITCRMRDPARKLLNAEDMDSEGRDFLLYVLSRHSIPVHLIETASEKISREEFLSFAKLGVRDVLSLKGGRQGNAEAQLLERCDIAYRQGSMQRLARENKVLSYQTAQSVSRSRTAAEITLFDFRLSLATDVDDSKHILDNVSKPNIRFPDVIGAEDAKRELSYFAEYLKDPVKYMRKGVRAPKGVLLYGPPGTGKTLLAKAMAGESEVTFLTAEGNQFLRRYVGEGAEAVHALFASARKYAPAILFIDEIDAIGKDRNGGNTNESTGDVLTAFLTEMDGFNTDTAKPVFVLAATNYEVEPGKGRSLDPALLRRFDRRIYVDLPTKEERKRFLCMKVARNRMVSLSEEQIENIAVRSTGMSLAELDSVCEMALRNALLSDDCTVDDAAFEEAFETFNGGERKQWSADSLERTARHEAGHALLCRLGGEKPSYLTVVARGDHGGYMQHGDSEDKGLYTKAELLQRIRTALAGRAAELVYYGEEAGISTGASGDLYTATRVAEQMLCHYGMDAELGLSFVERIDGTTAYGGEIRRRVNEILATELKNTRCIIEQHRAVIDRLAEALMAQNHLKEKEIEDILCMAAESGDTLPSS